MTRRARPHAQTHRPPAPPGQPLRPRSALAIPVLACTGVVASVLSPTSALAVELGDLQVQSSLGEALRATLTVDLAPGEFAGSSCVSAVNAGDPDLRTVPAARVQMAESATPGPHALEVTTTAPLFEPMYALALQVRCPGTPLVVRQYVLMLDLPGTNARATAAATAAPATVATAASPAAPGSTATVLPQAPAEAAPRPPRPRTAGPRLAANREPIAVGSPYRVREGDTLSGIAVRVAHHGGGTAHDVAEQIYAANPSAFIGGNRNLIKLGSEIVVPATPVATATAPPAAAPSAPPPAPVIEAPVASPATAAATAPAPELPTTAVAPTDAAASPVPASAPAAAVAPAGPETSNPRVFADEVPAIAPVTPAVPAAPPRTASHPVLSALVGLVLGLVISLALMRQRLLDGLARLLRRAPAAEPVAPMVRPTQGRARPVQPRRLHAPDSMVVEESHPAEDTIGVPDVVAPSPAPDVPAAALATTPDLPDALSQTGTLAATPVADLGSLFDDPAVTAELPDTAALTAEAMKEAATVQARTLGEPATLDLDLTNAISETGEVESIGWLGDADDDTQTRRSLPVGGELPDAVATAAAPDDAAKVDASNLDLHALAQVDSADDKLSATLREALALLERDYEEEFSASQVLNLRERKPGTEEPTSATLKDAWGTTRAEPPPDPDATLSRTGTDRRGH